MAFASQRPDFNSLKTRQAFGLPACEQWIFRTPPGSFYLATGLLKEHQPFASLTGRAHLQQNKPA
jgi:hypothetical protein